MVKQYYKVDVDYDVVEEGGVIGIQVIDMDKVIVQVREQGYQFDCVEGFQCEGGVYLLDRELVEWQVNDEEDYVKWQVGGIVDQKGYICCFVGQGIGLVK